MLKASALESPRRHSCERCLGLQLRPASIAAGVSGSRGGNTLLWEHPFLGDTLLSLGNTLFCHELVKCLVRGVLGQVDAFCCCTREDEVRVVARNVLDRKIVLIRASRALHELLDGRVAIQPAQKAPTHKQRERSLVCME